MVEHYEYKHVNFVKGYYYKTKNCCENTYFTFECIDVDDHNGWVKFKVLSDNDLEPISRFDAGVIIEYNHFSTVLNNITTERISEAKALAIAI